MTAHEQETRHWLQYAREDLDTTRVIASVGGVHRNACYFAQQSAETALKAIYVYLQREHPYKHDFVELQRGIPAGWRAVTLPNLSSLTQWVSEARYPTELPEADKDDARDAIAQVQDVYDSVFADFAAHGFAL